MGRVAQPVRLRLYERLEVCSDPACECSGCLLWTLSLDDHGYGRMWTGSKPAGTARPERVHIIAWELDNEPVPAGLHLDHVYDRGCRHKNCANVEHLEPVTPGENIRRSTQRITHCPKRHPYDEANTYMHRGKRYCRACHRDALDRWKARTAAA